MKNFLVLSILSTQLIHSQTPFNSGLPYSAYHINTVQQDEIVYFIGGYRYSSGNWMPIDSVFSYNLNTHEWTNLQNMVKPRYNMGLVIQNNMIHAMKGREGDNWIEVYNISSNTWTTYNDDSGDLIGNGSTNYDNFYTICNNIIYATNSSNGLWSSDNGVSWMNHGGDWMSNQAGEPTLVSSDDKVYIITGDQHNGAFVEFDPATSSFQDLASFSLHLRGYKNNPLYNNGKIYKFNNQDNGRIEVYDVESNTWEIFDFPTSNYGQELEFIEVDPSSSKFFVLDNNSSLNGFYFYADENPHIQTIPDYEIFENDTLEITLPVFTMGDDPYYFDAFSGLEDVEVSLNSNILKVIPEPNWVGVCEIGAIVLTDNGYADTTAFSVTVLQTDPRILAIHDIPGDQGGRVYINFSKSYFDQEDSEGWYNILGSYQIERLDELGWVGVGNYDAYAMDDYIIEVNTLSDSMESSNGMTTFRVIASMYEGTFISMPDSGYSVDNIAPGVPGGLMAVTMDDIIYLSWNRSTDEDFQYFVLEKATNMDFTEPEVIQTADTSYTDVNFTANETNYYRLVAADYAGNTSDYSEIVEASVLSIDENMVPAVSALHQNYPNPFNPTTQIKYDIAEDSFVRITIFDVMGRNIRTLMKISQTAGYHSIHWDAKNDMGEGVSAGMYIYTIQAGDFRQTKKMVLLK